MMAVKEASSASFDILVELVTKLTDEAPYDDKDPVKAITDPASKMTLQESFSKSASTERFLSTLECHFTWNLKKFIDKKFSLSNLVPHLEEKLAEGKLDEDHDKVLRVLQDLAFWSYKVNDFEQSVKYLSEASQLQLSAGELHVMKGNIAYMLYEQELFKACFDMIKSVVPYSRLNVTDKAIVYGIRAESTAELGDKSRIDALDQFEKAEVLDGNNYRWPLSIGKILRRIRKIENPYSPASEEEIHALRKAVSLGSPSLFLACSLSETAYARFKAGAKSKDVHTLNQEVFDIVTDIIRNQKKSAKCFLRCGEIIFRLPSYLRADALGDHCYEKAIQLAPDDSMINHKYGKYVERKHRDLRGACKYYEKAMNTSCSSNYPAVMDYIHLRCNLDRDWDVYEELKVQLERVSNPCHKAGFYAAQADYLIEADPEKALELYEVAVAMGSSSDNPDWGKEVIRFSWKRTKDGSRIKSTAGRYTRQNIHAVIERLEAQLQRDEED